MVRWLAMLLVLPLLFACTKSESPVVVQARADVLLGEQEVERARVALTQAQTELRSAQEAVTQADRDPAVLAARSGVTEAQQRWADNNQRYQSGEATYARAMAGVRLGGELTHARNVLGQAERMLNAARQRARNAEGGVNRAQETLRGAQAELARRRARLEATERATR